MKIIRNSVMGPAIDYDLGYIQLALGEMESYLLSKDLYWARKALVASGGKTYPQLTIGGLLMAFVCERARMKGAGFESQIIKLENQLERLKIQWRVAWDVKARWEFRSRLRQWVTYLHEVNLDPGEFGAYFPYQVRWRAILTLLGVDIGDVDGQNLKLLREADDILQTRFVPGEFIWELALQAGFPPDEYWYLWGKLRK
jgi:hypothetical protein